jgi:hypothetical protein
MRSSTPSVSSLSLSLTLSLSLALPLAACVGPDAAGDPELATETSELGNFPDLSPQATEVTSANGGGCMDLPLGLPAGSVLWLQQYPCNGGSNQRLRFEQVGSGVFRIHSAWDNNLCLDVPSGNYASGQDVQFFPCHSGQNQRWAVSVYSATHGVIKPEANNGLCLDVENASTGAAKIQLYGCGSPVPANRLWKFRTYLGNTTGQSCTGNVTINGNTLIPGLVATFSVPSGSVTSTCNAIPMTSFALTCPWNTNYMVANRNTANAGTAAFPIACFRQ